MSHEEHVRVAHVLVLRHGRGQAVRRLVDGTRANCEAMGVSERFDEPLTLLWGARIADAVEQGDSTSFEELVKRHPELLRSDLLGLPRWRAAG